MKSSQVHPDGEAKEFAKNSAKIKTFSSVMHVLVHRIPNTLFAAVAASTSFLTGFLFGLIWIALLLFFIYAFPVTNTLWEHKFVASTWYKAFGEELYGLKARHWMETYANCPEAQATNLSLAYPTDTENVTMILETVRARSKGAACVGGITGLSAIDASGSLTRQDMWDQFYETYAKENMTEGLPVDNQTALEMFEIDPVFCKCSSVTVDPDDDIETIEHFFAGIQESAIPAVNGWHNDIEFVDGLNDHNTHIKASTTDYAIGCCVCTYTSSNAPNTIGDFCGHFDDNFVSFYRLRPDPENMFYVAWDMNACMMVFGLIWIVYSGIGIRYAWEKNRKGVMVTLAICTLFFTAAGDTLWRGVIGVGFKPKAALQIVVVTAAAIHAGTTAAKLSWREKPPTDYPLKFTKKWYIWSSMGPTLLAAFAGPFAVTILVEAAYNDVDTGEGTRLFLATFAIPIIFWIIMTVGRFANGRMCQYGRSSNHPIEKVHDGALVFTTIQFIYAIYARAFVAGTSGATEDVRYSIAARQELILASLLSNVLQIAARRTTQWRDTQMYATFFCGKRSIGPEYFSDPNVSRFLERDLLIYESFFDAMALSYVTFLIFVYDVYTGVDPTLAFGAGLINWFVQMIAEQLGNYIIFYIRQRRKVFTSRHGIKATVAASEGSEQTKDNADDVSAGESVFSISMRLFKVLWRAKYVCLMMPYFGLLLSSLVGGSYTRAAVIYWREKMGEV